MSRTRLRAGFVAGLAAQVFSLSAEREARAAGKATTESLCAALLAESEPGIREAGVLALPLSEEGVVENLHRELLRKLFAPERLCAGDSTGVWAIVFGKPWTADRVTFVPWRLAHLDAEGRRTEIPGENPFVGDVELWLPARPAAASLIFGGADTPRLVVGDFDRDGTTNAIVFSAASWVVDPGREPDPEYGDDTYWPKDFQLGIAYTLSAGRIERLPVLHDTPLTSAGRGAGSDAWELKSYGPFFQFKAANEFDVYDTPYPIFGPDFTVFRQGAHGLTLDDPRQLPLLRAQCQAALRECGNILPIERVAIFDAVCERVPGAPLLRKNKECAHSIAGAQRSRPAAWFERFRRIPVPGVPRRTQRKPKPYRARFLWEYPVEVQRSTCTWEPLPRRPENE